MCQLPRGKPCVSDSILYLVDTEQDSFLLIKYQHLEISLSAQRCNFKTAGWDTVCNLLVHCLDWNNPFYCYNVFCVH